MKSFALLYILIAYFNYSYSQQCRIKQFRCTDGRCLEGEKICNTIEDCPSGEDERGDEHYDCTKQTLASNCGADFACRFGGCVPRTKLCDSIPDCWGGTDEATELCARRPGYIPPSPGTTRPSAPAVATTPIKPRPTRPPQTTTERITTPRQTRPPPPPPPATTQRPVRVTTPPPPPPPPAQSEGGDTCPPISVSDGQTARCFHQDLAEVIQCLDRPSPAGTSATLSCMRYWRPPPIGSITTTKTCEGGKWVGGNRRFRCDLECGEGGFPPIALIAGGRPSIKGKWPWNTGLYEVDPGTNQLEHICGSTLISRRAVLTAAHCVTIYQTTDPKAPKSLFAFVGKFNRSASENDETVQPRKISSIDIHPDYNSANLEADIAIIWLMKDVQITSYVHPACVPNEEDDVEVGNTGTLAGWGSIGDRQYPPTLQEAELPVVSRRTCKESHPALKNLVRPTTFCAGYRNGTSACDGDSGGGLVFNHGGKWLIQGIVSGGVPKAGGRGCDPHHYVAYTNVAKYRTWIDGKLDANSKKK